MSLAAFEASYLTPAQFKEILRATFNLQLNPKELSAVIHDFRYSQSEGGQGNSASSLQVSGENIVCKKFIIKFLQIGFEERTKNHLLQLEKQREQDRFRTEENARKLRKAEEKMILSIDYACTAEEEKSAFEKLTESARKYDKNGN